MGIHIIGGITMPLLILATTLIIILAVVLIPCAIMEAKDPELNNEYYNEYK